jgi:hypothetical protein
MESKAAVLSFPRAFAGMTSDGVVVLVLQERAGSARIVIARRPKADAAIQEPQGALRSPGSPRPCGLAMTMSVRLKRGESSSICPDD